MKSIVRRVALTTMFVALIATFSVASAEAARRHRARVHVSVPGYSATYRGHHGPYSHRSVSRVRIHSAPVVIVPAVPLPRVPHYGHRGPSVYLYGRVW